LKIALTADPELPVPPRLYGGIERVIDLLARGLVHAGHEVTLFAHPESQVPCELVPYAGKSSQSRSDTLRNMATVSARVAREGFDIVHSFGRIAYLLPLLPLSIPKLMTYQRTVNPRSIRWGHRLSRGTLQFAAISEWMMAEVRDLARWHVVFNAVPMDRFSLAPEVSSDAPLVFLGRIEHIKGTHLAIDIARKCGRRLVIAGNIPPGEQGYFDQQVAPHLDGERIRYIGPVDDARKDEVLGSACALLMPILWEEPFGIVMAEALACGTPVLGLRRGSVPEVVSEGVTGFVRDTADELVLAVQQLSAIDRARCRQRAQDLFSGEALVRQYLAVYGEMVGSR
jgi:glycosyltransferase involved in cell wall biosynthesis